jgi:hypothetical protein
MRLRPWRAFLLAPLATPVAYWIDMSVETTIDPGRHGPSLVSAVYVLGFIAWAALPVSYLATVVAGAPLWLLARRRGLLVWVPIAAGAVAGVVTARILAPSFHGDLFSIPMGPWRGAALGGLTAAVWWRLLQARR